MDEVLNLVEEYVFEPYMYPEDWRPRDDLLRQSISLLLLTGTSAVLLYLITAGVDYHFFFDKRLEKHPKFLPNQIAKEMSVSLKSLPIMALMSVPLFLMEVNGKSMLYDQIDERGWGYYALSIFMYLMWNDFAIYWIHRGLHSPLLYKPIHKLHHKWLVSTPFASHAFHPLDGFSQGLPYHLFVLVVPLHKWTFLVLFVAVNVWTVSIHDGIYKVPKALDPYVNGAAHHTDHHLYFSYNYGQFFTIWDRIGGSFREPSALHGKGPLDQILNMNKKVT